MSCVKGLPGRLGMLQATHDRPGQIFHVNEAQWLVPWPWQHMLRHSSKQAQEFAVPRAIHRRRTHDNVVLRQDLPDGLLSQEFAAAVFGNGLRRIRFTRRLSRCAGSARGETGDMDETADPGGGGGFGQVARAVMVYPGKFGAANRLGAAGAMHHVRDALEGLLQRRPILEAPGTRSYLSKVVGKEPRAARRSREEHGGYFLPAEPAEHVAANESTRPRKQDFQSNQPELLADLAQLVQGEIDLLRCVSGHEADPN